MPSSWIELTDLPYCQILHGCGSSTFPFIFKKESGQRDDVLIEHTALLLSFGTTILRIQHRLSETGIIIYLLITLYFC